MTEPNYISFIAEVKQQILKSRYQAARLVNREQLLLYFVVGKQLAEKVNTEKWGTKVIEQIAEDLQKELPGLKGFSYRNLRNMRQFADEYLPSVIQPLSMAEIQNADNQASTIGQLITAQFEGLTPELFFGIGFTQHILLLNKCKDWKERLFYLQKTAESYWTVEMLEWQIKANLYQKQGATL